MKRIALILSLLASCGGMTPAYAQLPPNLLAMGVDTARMLGAHGAGVPIAFFDTGLRLIPGIKPWHSGGQPCATGLNGYGPCGTPDPTNSFDELNQNCTGPDESHGNSVVGLAAGKYGVADSASVYMFRIVQPTGTCRFQQPAIWQGLATAMDSGFKFAVIAQAQEPSLAFYLDTLQSQVFVSRGGIICAAAGNDGHSYLQWPALINGVFGVGSIEPDGSLSSYSNFSGYGTQVSYVVYGTNVLSDFVCHGCATASTRYNTGTSFGPPQVCGHFATVWGVDTTMTRAEVVAVTDATVFFPGHAPGDSIYYGKGLPQTGKAVCALLCAGPIPDSNSLTLTAGHTDSIHVTPHNGKPWATWTTAPGVTVTRRGDYLIVTASTPGTYTAKLGTTSPDSSSLLRGH